MSRTSADSDQPRSGSLFQEHVHGALSLGTMIGFWAHDCRQQGIIDAIAHQNELAITGLAVLALISIVYLGSQAKKLLRLLGRWRSRMRR